MNTLTRADRLVVRELLPKIGGDMLRPFSRFSAVFLFSLLIAIQVSAVEYEFRLIADSTSDTLPSGHGPISMNNMGVVSFWASEFDPYRKVVYASDGVQYTPIADTLGPLDNVQSGAINDSGMATFWALEDGFGEIWIGDGVTNTLVSVVGSKQVAPINNAGHVAYVESLPGSQLGFNVWDGESTYRVADTLGELNNLRSERFLDPFDRLAFMAWRDDGTTAIFLADAQGIEVLADTRDEFANFGLSGGMFMSDNGEYIGFRGEKYSGDRGIFRYTNGVSELVVSEDGDFSSLGLTLVNSSGDFVFNGRLAPDVEGWFTGPDAATDRVILTGDELFGGTFTAGSVVDINDQGEIVFDALIDDDRFVIGIASPIPEPTSISLFVLGLLPYIRRRRQTGRPPTDDA